MYMYAEYFKSVMVSALWNCPKFNQDICCIFCAVYVII